MANIKSIKIQSRNRYELIILFELNKGKDVKEIFEKLKENGKPYVPLSTLYKYHNRYKYAERKARELQKKL